MKEAKVKLYVSLLFLIMALFFALNRPISAEEEYKLITEWGSKGSAEGEFDFPLSIATDKLGNVYVVDMGNQRIQKFTTNGEFLISWNFPTNEEPGIPQGIDLDDSGDVYVSGGIVTYGYIVKYNTVGNEIKRWESSSSLNPVGTLKITIDKMDNIYMSGMDNELKWNIEKYNIDGTFVTNWITDLGEYNNASGSIFDIASDDTGNIYIPDGFNNQILKYNSDGILIKKWGSIGYEEDGQFANIQGIAVDKYGYIYVRDGLFRIQKFTSDGIFITKRTTRIGSISYDMEVDEEGYVYILDYSSKRVLKYDKISETSPITTTSSSPPCPSEAIYGEHSEQTELLRYIRDGVLSKSPEGREIIRLYYQWSPSVVKAMDEDEEFKEGVKEMIDGVLELVRQLL